MYVVGFASTTRGPGTPPGSTPRRASATAACGRRESSPDARAPNVDPVRRASSSSTIWPTLWRLPAYCGPGFPKPTTSQGPSLIGDLLLRGTCGNDDARHRQERYRAPRCEAPGERRYATLTLRCASQPSDSAAAADAADCEAARSAAAASAATSSAE